MLEHRPQRPIESNWRYRIKRTSHTREIDALETVRRHARCGASPNPGSLQQITMHRGSGNIRSESDVGLGLLDQAPELKTLAIDGFFDRMA
jgi:hypothetical protein